MACERRAMACERRALACERRVLAYGKSLGLKKGLSRWRKPLYID